MIPLTTAPMNTQVQNSTNAPSAQPTQPFQLRAYQWEGIYFLRDRQRAMLCDEPRLGKTVQAVFATEVPALIVAPGYLLWQWHDFLVQCGIRQDRIALCIGTHDEKQAQLDRPADWYICNIEMLRKHPQGPYTKTGAQRTKPAPRNFRFQIPRTFIVDESHHLRGRNSLQSQGAQELAIASGRNGFTAAERVYLLTGTPVYNKPDDLFAQLRLLDPKRFSSYHAFTKEYCNVVDLGFGPRVVGVSPNHPNAANFYKPLRDVFNSYSLTRTQEGVGLQLSPLTEQVLRVPSSAGFQKDYQKLRHQYIDPDGMQMESLMEAMHALRRLTFTMKIEPLLQLLVDGNALHHTVIFTEYKSTAKAVANMLDFTLITGDEPAIERPLLAKHSDHIVATTKALTEGIDLSHIRNVVFLEHDHVPGRTYQALSRNALCPHPRHVYHIVVKDTIDETILKANKERAMTIKQIVQEALL